MRIKRAVPRCSTSSRAVQPAVRMHGAIPRGPADSGVDPCWAPGRTPSMEWAELPSRAPLGRAAAVGVDHESERQGRVAMICHSHGGHVARMASAFARRGRPDRLMICLGTLFFVIDFRKRLYHSRLLCSAQLLANVVGIRDVSRRGWTSRKFEVVANGWLIAFGGYLSSELLLQGVARNLRRLPVRQLAAQTDPPECFAKVHVVTAPADEASLALSVGQFVGVMSGRATAILDYAEETAGRRWKEIAAVF
jgi:hypothetical protein